MRVYLDTNHWINLAKRHYDNPNSLMLRVIKEKIARNELKFPVSSAHCMEMMKHGSPDWRHRLWTFVVSVSQCNAILPKQVVLGSLIEQAFCEVLDVSHEGGLVDVFSKSCLFGLWSSNEFPLTYEASQREDGWLRFWLDMPEGIRDKLFNGLRSIEEQFLNRRAKVKKKMKRQADDLRKRAYMASLFYDLQDHYVRVARKYSVNEEWFRTMSLNEAVSLITKVPPLDVECALAIQHQKQLDKPEHVNDIRDITHLCMAVPYCDVVITERYWIDKVQREKIDTKYKTRLLANLLELELLLA